MREDRAGRCDARVHAVPQSRGGRPRTLGTAQRAGGKSGRGNVLGGYGDVDASRAADSGLFRVLEWGMMEVHRGITALLPCPFRSFLFSSFFRYDATRKCYRKRRCMIGTMMTALDNFGNESTQIAPMIWMIRRCYGCRSIYSARARCGIPDSSRFGSLPRPNSFPAVQKGAVAILTQYVERNDLTALFYVKWGSDVSRQRSLV